MPSILQWFFSKNSLKTLLELFQEENKKLLSAKRAVEAENSRMKAHMHLLQKERIANRLVNFSFCVEIRIC